MQHGRGGIAGCASYDSRSGDMTRIGCRVAGLAEDLRRQAARFGGDLRGVSAVEFAILVPVMLTLYFGAAEVGQAVAVDRKVTITARTVADLVAQGQAMAATDLTNSLSAAAAVIAPYDATKLKVTVSVINIDSNKTVTIPTNCSQTLNGTKKTVATVPDALKIANTLLVWGEVEYSYKPVIGYMITGTMTLKDQIYMSPRRVSSAVTSC
jgi:Flp pilus assembly protein TadG